MAWNVHNCASVAALVQIFQGRDARLLEIMVQGDEIHTRKGYGTRSKVKAGTF